MNCCPVVLGDDPHRRGLAVDDEETAAAQGDEAELARALDHGTDRCVVRAQHRVLAGGPVRRCAVGEVNTRRDIEHERVRRVVGVDPLEELPVLVGDGNVRLVRRGDREVHLASATVSDRCADAVDRRPACRVEEDDMPRGDERDDRVRLGSVDRQHVRSHRVDARLGEAHGGDAAAEVDLLRNCRLALRLLEVVPIPDVQRPPVREAWRIRLVDRPHLVCAAPRCRCSRCQSCHDRRGEHKPEKQQPNPGGPASKRRTVHPASPS